MLDGTTLWLQSRVRLPVAVRDFFVRQHERMDAPGFFIIAAVGLFLVFGACMLTGAVWLFFGWRKKARSVQILSALPFGVGLFIVGPLLLIAVAMVVWWFMADWRAIPESTAPAPQEQQTPNQGDAGKGAVALLFHLVPSGRALPEHHRSTLVVT